MLLMRLVLGVPGLFKCRHNSVKLKRDKLSHDLEDGQTSFGCESLHINGELGGVEAV
jgi:hypothetical protein